MKIEWNKVTWYSKLLAIIIFVATFYVGFVLGNLKEKVNNINNPERSFIKLKK